MQKVVNRVACLIAVTAIAGCFQNSSEKEQDVESADASMSQPSINGLFLTPKEIAGYTETMLLLQDQHYQYWFYSDLRGQHEPQYPIKGAFSFDGENIRLDGEHVSQKEWRLVNINGVQVLMREDAYSLWIKEGQLYDYGILIYCPPAPDNTRLENPSIRVLVDDAASDWKDPFVHDPK